MDIVCEGEISGPGFKINLESGASPGFPLSPKDWAPRAPTPGPQLSADESQVPGCIISPLFLICEMQI